LGAERGGHASAVTTGTGGPDYGEGDGRIHRRNELTT
jgi:hypothetical protein